MAPDQDPATNTLTLTLPPAAAVALPAGLSPSPILACLLRMADNYHRGRSFHQAIELYFQIIEQHPNTIESRQARDRLLTLCEWYERQGSSHMARSLYERLLTEPGEEP